MSKLIFGYTWEQIQRAQRGAPLHRKIDPASVSKPICTKADVDLLIQHGPQGLRDMGFYGVLDRLQRAELA